MDNCRIKVTEQKSMLSSAATGALIGYGLKTILPVTDLERMQSGYDVFVKDTQTLIKTKVKKRYLDIIKQAEKEPNNLIYSKFAEAIKKAKDAKISLKTVLKESLKNVNPQVRQAILELNSSIKIQAESLRKNNMDKFDTIVKHSRSNKGYLATGAVIACVYAFFVNLARDVAHENS